MDLVAGKNRNGRGDVGAATQWQRFAEDHDVNGSTVRELRRDCGVREG